MVKVFEFPDVSFRGTEWTTEHPISKSKSIFTGRRYTSSSRRPRQKVVLEVAGLGVDDIGAGRVEVLKQLLLGGQHLVRIERFAPYRARAGLVGGGSSISSWTVGSADAAWKNGASSAVWYNGLHYGATSTTDGDMPAVLAQRLPENTLIARPSDRVEFIAANGETQRLTVVDNVVSSSGGEATIRVIEEITETSGQLRFGSPETAVFEPDVIPRSLTPVNGDWIYKWEFTEVFEDETDGFQEVSAWK